MCLPPCLACNSSSSLGTSLPSAVSPSGPGLVISCGCLALPCFGGALSAIFARAGFMWYLPALSNAIESPLLRLHQRAKLLPAPRSHDLRLLRQNLLLDLAQLLEHRLKLCLLLA